MGRRTITTEITAGEAPEETAEEREPGLSLFDASGDNRVRMLRRDEKTQKWMNHGYFPPTATDEDVLKKYGGGQYWAQLLVQGAEGGESIKQSRKFTLIGPYYPPTTDLPGVRDNPPQASSNGNNVVAGIPTSGNDLMDVLKAGIINTLLEMMKSNKEMRAPTGPDPVMLELMRAQAATQQKIMEFMLTLATKDNGDSKKDMLELMASMKELVAPPPSNGAIPADPMQMFNNMLETFKSFREAAEDVSPPRSDNPVLDSIPKLAEVVYEQHQLSKQRSEVSTVPVPANGGIAQMPVVNRMPAPDDRPIWKKVIQQQGARLLAQAAAKSDPDVIAGAAILFAPPNVREALALFFHREVEEVSADILAELPQMAEHREWLDEFVECAQTRLFPEEFVDEGEETEGGDK